MRIRPVAQADRAEWLRMLRALHPELPASAHIPSIDAFLSQSPIDELIPSAVYVADRGTGQLGGFLELSVRNGLAFPTDGIVGTEFEHGAVAFFDLEGAFGSHSGTRQPGA
jgi:hypothetical protein